MTIKEIAKLAGVSPSTVSKIINNKDENINIDTRNRVLSIVKEYNYKPYASAINASTSKTFLIGVLVKSTIRSASLVQGLLETLQKNGYRIILCNSMSSNETELKNIMALQSSNVDGVIWEPVNEKSLDYSHYFQNKNKPVQFINCNFHESSYNIDFVNMGYMAAQTLLSYNHSKIGCLVKENSFRSLMALEGFKKCLFDHEISFSNDMILPKHPEEYCPYILANEITGIITTHFSLALNFYETFYKLQYRIPNDLSLVSLRDEIRENISFPKISSIKTPYYEFGLYLGKEILRQCENDDSTPEKFKSDFALENTSSLDVPFPLKTPSIIVVGSINIDITLNVEDMPQSGKTISTNKSSVTPGGKGANQAMGVAKLEYPVSLIGKVGHDYEASIIYNSLQENHIDISGINRDGAAETGKAYIHVQNDGESTISILTGANHFLSPADIKKNERLFKNSCFCLLQTEIPFDTVVEAAKTARAYGSKTILKPAALNKITSELLTLTDIFIPNVKEAALLCPETDSLEGQADYFLQKGAGMVIITAGQAGCFVKTNGYMEHFPAVKFTPIDTTGAADAFISALAVYLATGYPIEKAIRIASYAAGFSITRQGVISSLIDRKSLEIYIKQQEPQLLELV